ncbi:MAG: TetR/AcrR family transcriptional regulator [Pseudomonadota bacterium]|nr:TetR/AcrR family transcriptional regulator [Pseudomonadota bacterium]
MARLAKFGHDQIVGVTTRIAAKLGPEQATIARIADALQAPTGSIYHRFASRNMLLGEVWLRSAESFQAGFAAAISGHDALAAGLAGALFVSARVRAEPEQARILLLHRRSDFLGAGWPVEMADRAAALKKHGDAALRRISKALLGRTDADALRTVTYALVDAPLAAVLPHIRANQPPPASVDALIRATYSAVITQALATPSISTTRRT